MNETISRTITIKIPLLTSSQASLIFHLLSDLCARFFDAYNAEIMADAGTEDPPDDIDDGVDSFSDADIPF